MSAKEKQVKIPAPGVDINTETSVLCTPRPQQVATLKAIQSDNGNRGTVVTSSGRVIFSLLTKTSLEGIEASCFS